MKYTGANQSDFERDAIELLGKRADMDQRQWEDLARELARKYGIDSTDIWDILPEYERTTAQRVAELMGGDGQEFKLPDGRELDEICRDHGAAVERGDGHVIEGLDAPIDPQWTRYAFADGSAIVDCDTAWDIEGATPWSWEGAE